MVFGTFDIIHTGHLHLFSEAKKLGDRLIVVVSRDTNAETVKGKKPFFNEDERLNIVSHIDFVDTALLGSEDNVYEVIDRLKPEIIVLGYDQRAFTHELNNKLAEMSLHTQIIRATPMNIAKYKSSHIKEYIQHLI